MMRHLALLLASSWSVAIFMAVMGYRTVKTHHTMQRRLFVMGSRGVEGSRKRLPVNWLGTLRNSWSQGQNAAALKLRMSEYVLFIGGAFVIPAITGYVVRGLAGALLLGLVGVGAVLVYFKLRKQRYLHLAEQSLPDFIRGISGALRAGTSLTQAMALVAKETPDPLGFEIARVLRRESFGFSFEQTLEELTTRIPSKDLALTVMVINIQREIGGSLADILENIVGTIVARQTLTREVRALTAQGRMSGWVLTALPFVLGVAIWFLNPHYIDPLFHTTTGLIMVGSALVSVALGGFVINRMVRSPQL